jgi:hypothetical protein
MVEFVVKSVPSAGVSNDGERIMVRIADAAGNEMDLVAHYAQLEEITNALNEAANRAHDTRRALGKVDPPGVTVGDVQSHEVLGFRFLVAGDKSHLVLQLQTPSGRLDIRFGKDAAMPFAEATSRNVVALMAPVQSKGH